MTKKIYMKDYQKPELTYIDDSAFDETGQGSSGFSPARNNNGNHYGGGNGGGRYHR